MCARVPVRGRAARLRRSMVLRACCTARSPHQRSQRAYITTPVTVYFLIGGKSISMESFVYKFVENVSLLCFFIRAVAHGHPQHQRCCRCIAKNAICLGGWFFEDKNVVAFFFKYRYIFLVMIICNLRTVHV